jgi:hypothetical protein
MAASIKNWEERRLTKNDFQIQGLLKTFLATEDSFFSQKANFTRGKTFENRQKALPEGRRYEEFEVTPEQTDSRRIIVDLDSYEVYISLCHYMPGSFWYAGKVGQL